MAALAGSSVLCGLGDRSLAAGRSVEAAAAAAPASVSMPAPEPSGLIPGLDSERRHRAALARYRALASAGGWAALPPGRALRVGVTDARVPILRKRLAATGDYPAEPDASPLYDSALARSVMRFQYRHGLAVDGVVGRRTRAALNVPVEDRIGVLAINLQRLRETRFTPARRRIVVNIPAFELFAITGPDRPAMHMRVVVGTPARPTPELSFPVDWVSFNPFWNIPASIAAGEILPKLQLDPGILRARRIRVFPPGGPDGAELDPDVIDWWAYGAGKLPYKLRQDPGPSNPMGQVKIALAGSPAIFLHDTPTRSAFDRRVRALSHGCIRVADAADLAAFVLGDDGKWTAERIDAVVRMGRHVAARPGEPVPVHLIYRTAWVDLAGRAHFRADIYGHDPAAMGAIEAAEAAGCGS